MRKDKSEGGAGSVRVVHRIVGYRQFGRQEFLAIASAGRDRANRTPSRTRAGRTSRRQVIAATQDEATNLSRVIVTLQELTP